MNSTHQPSISEDQLPKNKTQRWWMIAALVGILVAGVAMAWGFVAPAENPDVPPVAADGELPVE